MSQYFDKDFFKFFTGFMVIIVISLTIILVTRIYEQRLAGENNTASVIEVTTH
ncbi:MAG TPA: hypothetical protein VGC58_03040 [Candidatus Paceibacterota bacterium]